MMRLLYTILILIVLILTIVLSEAKAQETIKYDISVAGFSIGEMTAKKNKSGQDTKYEIESAVSFWFFGSVSVDFRLLANYNNKNILTGATTVTKTSKGDFYSDIRWLDDRKHYKIAARSYKYELDTIISKPYDFSSIKLYFEEPVHHKDFLAENFGLSSSIKKVKDYYEVNVNGNKNRFFYEDGKLQKAVMESPIKNYVIKRKEP